MDLQSRNTTKLTIETNILSEGLIYRMTGKQSVERLYPLLIRQLNEPAAINSAESLVSMKISEGWKDFDHRNSHSCCFIHEKIVSNPTQDTLETIDNENQTKYTSSSKITLIPLFKDLDFHSSRKLYFVWETFCEKDWKLSHDSAITLNRLQHSQIIENKGNFAFLQLKAQDIVTQESQQLGLSPTLRSYYLDSYIALTYRDIKTWTENKWNQKNSTVSSDHSDWWVLKACRGNGGKDIWILTCTSYLSVLEEISKRIDEEYVIQRYVDRPRLWQGKKYHYRCYSLLQANMSVYLYSKVFILTAGLDYIPSDSTDTSPSVVPETSRHITNLSVNKRFKGHPGQIPYDIYENDRQVFNDISLVWNGIIAAATPFMKYQKSSRHFEFFGLDVIVDELGHAWLIEANRLPGLESSNNNFDEENIMYDEMMASLLDIVLYPEIYEDKSSYGLWRKIKTEDKDIEFNPSLTWKNLFAWKAFTMKNRSKMLCKT